MKNWAWIAGGGIIVLVAAILCGLYFAAAPSIIKGKLKSAKYFDHNYPDGIVLQPDKISRMEDYLTGLTGERVWSKNIMMATDGNVRLRLELEFDNTTSQSFQFAAKSGGRGLYLYEDNNLWKCDSERIRSFFSDK